MIYLVRDIESRSHETGEKEQADSVIHGSDNGLRRFSSSGSLVSRKPVTRAIKINILQLIKLIT